MGQNPNYWVSHLKHFRTTLNGNFDLLSQHLLTWWAFPLVDSYDHDPGKISSLFRTACTCIYIHKNIKIINGYQFIIRILSFNDLQLVYWFEQKCHRF